MCSSVSGTPALKSYLRNSPPRNALRCLDSMCRVLRQNGEQKGDSTQPPPLSNLVPTLGHLERLQLDSIVRFFPPIENQALGLSGNSAKSEGRSSLAVLDTISGVNAVLAVDTVSVVIDTVFSQRAITVVSIGAALGFSTVSGVNSVPEPTTTLKSDVASETTYSWDLALFRGTTPSRKTPLSWDLPLSWELKQCFGKQRYISR